MPTGYILMGRGDALPDTSARLFWDSGANELGIGTSSPDNQLHSHKASGNNHGIFSAGSNWLAFFSGSATDPYLYFSNSRGLHMASSTSNLGAGIHEILYLGTTGNVGFSTQTFGTSADNVIGIGNGTAPTTSPSNMVQLYSAAAELIVRDGAGNVTTLSPHNFSLIGEKSHELAWSYYSEKDGMAINVDMFRVVQLLEELTGEKLIHIKSIK
jgi:hypothetical protein